MIGDMVIGFCGHYGYIVSGSGTVQSNGIQNARVGDSVTGCLIGKIVSGSTTTLCG